MIADVVIAGFYGDSRAGLSFHQTSDPDVVLCGLGDQVCRIATTMTNRLVDSKWDAVPMRSSYLQSLLVLVIFCS